VTINYKGLGHVQWNAYFWFHCMISQDV